MIFMDLKGTSNSYIQIQKGGPRIANLAGVIEARDAAGTGFADLYGNVLKAAADSLILNNDAAGAAADWKYTIARPASGMASALTITLPPTAGSSGNVLQTDGAGVLSWVAPSAPSGVMNVRSTSFGFATVSPIALFSLPANAAVDEVKVIIDTQFTGAPSLTVGLVGTLNKYMDTTDVDLTSTAGDAWSAAKNLVPVGAIEALIATYVAGGAGAGAARIVVKYY